MKIKEYIIVAGTQGCNLVDIVQEMINSGWQPIGCPYVSFEEDIFLSECQAMVKYEEPEYYGFGTPPENIAASHPDILKPKERKVVDVCHLHQMPSIEHIILHRDELMNKGWTFIEEGHVEAYGWYLKMVKYE